MTISRFRVFIPSTTDNAYFPRDMYVFILIFTKNSRWASFSSIYGSSEMSSVMPGYNCSRCCAHKTIGDESMSGCTWCSQAVEKPTSFTLAQTMTSSLLSSSRGDMVGRCSVHVPDTGDGAWG